MRGNWIVFAPQNKKKRSCRKVFSLKSNFRWIRKITKLHFRWCRYIFLFSEVCLAHIAYLFSTLLWYYLMVHCSLRYKVLRSDLKTIGISNAKTGHIRNFSDNMYHRELKASIEAYFRINFATNSILCHFKLKFPTQLRAS